MKLKSILMFIATVYLVLACNNEQKDLDVFTLDNKILNSEYNTEDFQDLIPDLSYHPNKIIHKKLKSFARDLKSQTKDKEILIQKIKEYFDLNIKKGLRYEERYGSPVYNLAQYKSDERSEVLFVPTAFENSSKTEGIVLIYYNKGSKEFKFHELERKAIKNLDRKNKLGKSNGKFTKMSKELAATLFAYFDYTLFEYNDCELIELLDYSRDVVCRGTWYEVTECYCSKAGGVISCYDCTTYYEFDGICSSGSGGEMNYGSGGSGPINEPNYDSNYGDASICLAPYGNGYSGSTHNIKFKWGTTWGQYREVTFSITYDVPSLTYNNIVISERLARVVLIDALNDAHHATLVAFGHGITRYSCCA